MAHFAGSFCAQESIIVSCGLSTTWYGKFCTSWECKRTINIISIGDDDDGNTLTDPPRIQPWSQRSTQARNAKGRTRPINSARCVLFLCTVCQQGVDGAGSSPIEYVRPTEEACGSPVSEWQDGVCDAALNVEQCNYDGGMCFSIDWLDFLSVSYVKRKMIRCRLWMD